MASDENECRKIARRVRALRIARNMTQEEIAERVGLFPPSVDNIEKGKAVLKLRRIFQLREIFGCSFRDFFEDAPENEPTYPDVTRKQDVGRRVREFRLCRKMSQRAVAERLGITPTGLSSIEHGRVDATLKNLFILRDLFGCSICSFFEERPITVEPWEPSLCKTELTYPEIGRRIQILRTARNLSLNEIARRTGIDLATISKIANGKSEPALSNLLKISGVLGCSMRDLFEDWREVETRPPAMPPSDNLDLEYLKIGQRIRAISAEKKISQPELAKRAGMHLLTLRLIERGQQHPPLKRLFRLSQVLECSISDFFEGPTKEDFSTLEAEYKKLGRRIRAIHVSKDSMEFAEGVGVDLDTLTEIEDGRKVPTLEHLYQIRGILGCGMRDFFDDRPIKGKEDLHVEDVVRAMRFMKKIKRTGMDRK